MPTTSPRRRRHRVVTISVTAAAVLAACGGGDDGTSGAPVTAPTVTAAPEETSADDRSGDTSDRLAGGEETVDAGSPTAVLTGFETLAGDTFDAAVLDGEATVLWFWAPWCTICRTEGPHVDAIAEAYGDAVRIVGVPGRDAVGPMEQFVADTGTGALTHVIDPDGRLWSEFGVFGQPAFAFIDADGEMEVVVGSLGARGLDERIGRLVST
ncbi:MAG: thioredoxin domain-containing protein [Ilumatobacteraceae bacterium]